jgi:hypothetical protein
MTHSSIQESSPGLPDYPSGKQPASLRDRIANAVFMLDATIGIGTIITVVLFLAVAGCMLYPFVAPFFSRPFSQTDQAVLKRQREWPIYIEETFDNDQTHTDADWGLGIESADDFEAYRELVDGKYFTWVDFWTSDRHVKSYHLITHESLSDFILSVDFEKPTGGEPHPYGVIFHYQDAGNFYMLTFDDNDYLSVEAWYQNRQEVLFVNVFHQNAIRPFQRNNLVLSFEDGHGLLLVNDQYVGRFDDTRFARGGLGFVVQLPYDDYAADISIDNVELRTPD